jgi:hypothetical protein
MTVAHEKTRLAPLSVGQAGRSLGVNKNQVDKLIGCGLIRVSETTGGGHRRVNPDDVSELANRPVIEAPAPGDLALHLAPLTVDDDPTHLRTHLGWHAAAAERGLTAEQIENAWTGLWNCRPEPHVGAALVGDVAGFVVALGTVTGYRYIAGRVRFLIEAPTPDIVARYAEKRFTAQAGDMVQRLGATDVTPDAVLRTGFGLAAVVSWQHRRGGKAHCLVRLYERGGTVTAVVSEIATSPPGRGVTDDFPRLAGIVARMACAELGTEPDAMKWVAHHGAFSNSDSFDAADTFTEIPLVWDGARFYGDLRAHRLVPVDDVQAVVGDPGLSDVGAVLADLNAAR